MDLQKFTLNYTILFSISPTTEIKKSSMVQVVYSNISPWRYHFALMRYSIKRYLNIDDRSVGPCLLRGKGGAVGTKGGAFPSPEGRLYGFLNTKRVKNNLTLIKHRYLYRLVFRKPYNQPSAEEMHPLFYSPPMGARSYGPIISI